MKSSVPFFEGVKALYKSTAVRCVEIRLFAIPTFYER